LSVQLEYFHSSQKIGRKQHIATPDRYFIPLNIILGLPYFLLRPPTGCESDDLPRIALTSDTNWEPSSLDNNIDTDSSEWYSSPQFIDPYGNHPFNHKEEYIHRKFNALLSESPLHCTVHETTIFPTLPDLEALQPRFGGCSLDTVHHTFPKPTLYDCSLHLYGGICHRFKSRFPAFTVSRRSEPVATDTEFSDTPAIDDDSRCAQWFVRLESLVTDIYSMKTDHKLINTLADNIRIRGAMSKLISDRDLCEISNKVNDLLRVYKIGN
jgi:hypothetical protein